MKSLLKQNKPAFKFIRARQVRNGGGGGGGGGGQVRVTVGGPMSVIVGHTLSRIKSMQYKSRYEIYLKRHSPVVLSCLGYPRT